MKRFWEIDALRGIAIVMMIAYHIFFNLIFFLDYGLNITKTWRIFQIITAGLFIMLAGVSLTISYSKAVKKKVNVGRKIALKSMKIYLFGMLITLATSIFLSSGTVYFGILHFIGLSILIGYVFVRFKYYNLLFACIIFAASNFTLNIKATNNLFLWLGLRPEFFYSVDYFPLLPWFGVFLIGIFLGNVFYAGAKRRFKIKESKNNIISWLHFAGRHSLLIYLVHQPVLILIMYILRYLGII
jgi:uncharacterized membrane protein